MGGSLIIAAGLVIFRFGPIIQYLLLQHSKGTHYWTPPKGHTMEGEIDLMATALRETQEESGLAAKDLKCYDLKKVVNYNFQGKKRTRSKEVQYFLAELINPESEVKLSKEHLDYKWLSFSEACKVIPHENFRNMLREFDEYIRNNLTVTDSRLQSSHVVSDQSLD